MQLPDLDIKIIEDNDFFNKLQNKFLWDEQAGIINSFRGENGFLSNFSDHKLTIAGLTFQTSEHAFQAFKTSDPEWFKQIAFAPNASESKRLAKICPMRDNWNVIRNYVMLNVLMEKFSFENNIGLTYQLINTYPKYLMEGNTWGDQYWGCTYSITFREWIGENKLGHLLMLVRYIRMCQDKFNYLIKQ